MRRFYAIKGGEELNVLFTPAAEWVRFAFARAGVDELAGEYESGDAVYLAYGNFPFLTANTINAAFAEYERKGKALSVMAGGKLIGAVVAAEDYSEDRFDYLALYARGKVKVHQMEGETAKDKSELLELSDLARSLRTRMLTDAGVEITDVSGVSISPYATFGDGVVIHTGTSIKGKGVIEDN